MRVIVATDDALLREVTRRTLTAVTDVRVRTVGDVESLVSVAGKFAGAVALTSCVLADQSVLHVIPTLLAIGCRTLLLTDDPDESAVTAALLAGAAGSVCARDCDRAELLAAVRAVGRGDAVLHPSAASVVLSEWRRMAFAEDVAAAGPPAGQALTRREQQVLDAIGDGLTATAIGRRLEISARTVESHKRRIFSKLGAADQAQAVDVAVRHGLLPKAGKC